MAKRPRDPNQLAHLIGQIATGQAQDSEPAQDRRNPAAVALGALGAAKGGKARAKSLSPAKRKQIAKKAAKARWSKQKPPALAIATNVTEWSDKDVHEFIVGVNKQFGLKDNPKAKKRKRKS